MGINIILTLGMWMCEWFLNVLIRFLCVHQWKVIHYHNSNTLINLAKGSKHRILAFENEANRQLQFSLLSSKLVVRDELVQECLYMCNQNFDQQKYFHCVAQLDEICMVWNFHQKKLNEDNDIISHVPKFLNVHHVVVKTFQGTQFLRCDSYLYERWVECFTWIHIFNEFIHIWIHLYNKFVYSMNSSVSWVHKFNEFTKFLCPQTS
jgi:hypothetical protein